jgi:hypothetical protein
MSATIGRQALGLSQRSGSHSHRTGKVEHPRQHLKQFQGALQADACDAVMA